MSRFMALKSKRCETAAVSSCHTLGGCGVQATCATTSRMRHSLHSDARSQSAAGRPSRRSARYRRSVATVAQIVFASIDRSNK